MARSLLLASPQHDQIIRAKLLNRLGIYQPQQQQQRQFAGLQQRNGGSYAGRGKVSTANVSTLDNYHPPAPASSPSTSTKVSASPALASSPPSSSSSRIRRRQEIHEEPLKEQQHHRRRSKNVANEKSTKVKFREQVTVVSIPSRFQYSVRMSKCLWNSANDIHTNAIRNIREYEHEGWDWHSVVEEDAMYVDSNTGDLVHPCWLAPKEDDTRCNKHDDDDESISYQDDFEEDDDFEDDDEHFTFMPLRKGESVVMSNVINNNES